MTDVIGWAIYGWAQAGEWLLLPAAIAAGWAATRITLRALRRPAARRAEAAARPAADLDALELLLELPAIDNHHRNTNTRKETS